MLHITDLNKNKELDCRQMARISGGNSDFERFAALLDFSTSISNTAADINQSFGFTIAQSNSGRLTNVQTINGGNGVVYAPVTQRMSQGNSLSLSDIGNAVVA